MMGYLDGRALDRAELDRRLAALRAGPRAGLLPAPGSAEDRQLTRWLAQVLLTERLCEAEAHRRGLDVATAPPDRLDRRAAVELGSITAAAYQGSAAVRAVFQAVTRGVRAPADQVAAYRVATDRPPAPAWRLSTVDGEFDATPSSLPAALAAALRAAVPGQTVTAGGWTATLVGAAPPAGDPGDPGDPGATAAAEVTAAARRAAFVRWLDGARARRLRTAPGLEHPGDPAQPDNRHRH